MRFLRVGFRVSERVENNRERPHRALKQHTPATYAAAWEPPAEQPG